MGIFDFLKKKRMYGMGQSTILSYSKSDSEDGFRNALTSAINKVIKKDSPILHLDFRGRRNWGIGHDLSFIKTIINKLQTYGFVGEVIIYIDTRKELITAFEQQGFSKGIYTLRINEDPNKCDTIDRQRHLRSAAA